MNPKQPPPPATPSITLWDVYYILFRHKWLVLILALTAIIAAVLVRVLTPVPYVSEAELLIKYVKETKPPDQTALDSQVTTPDSRGENVINSEIAILTSLDLINSVVEAVTPAKILAKAGGGTNRIEAAFLVRRGLSAGVTNKSDVIELMFSHPDADMVQPILGQIITSYQKMHADIHRPEFNEFLIRETDTVKGKLEETETALRDAKAKAGVLSLDESKRSLGDMISKTQEDIYQAEAEWAASQQTIKSKRDQMPKAAPAAPASTAPATDASAPPEKVKADYRRVCEQLSSLRAQEEALFDKGLTTNTTVVKTKEAQIAGADARRQQMEEKYPGLTAFKPAETKAVAVPAYPTVDPQVALNEEIIKSESLAAKIQALTNQLAELGHKAQAMTGQEGTILQLQKDYELEDAEFTYYSKRLDESRANEALGPGNSNISLVESPTPPSRSTKKVMKIVAGVLGGGLALALALPFIIELYLDRSLKRPTEVRSKLGVPFFISIPEINGNGRVRRRIRKRKKYALLRGKTETAVEPAGGGQPSAAPGNGNLAVWDRSHAMQPFYETLRDRLITFFEMINLTHKPKLVAVTSCGEGAGVTSTAAGLASSLSETGEGNVLLVNMNATDGEAHHFYKGRVNCGLEDVFEKGARDNALVQGHLYVAKEQEDEQLPRILPKRFSHLLPKMKASDFDYIIFDMPPVSQISITPRLARFMDMVLLVIESGKTDRDAAARATAVLSESKANVGVILNKSKSYGPRRHHHDI